MDGQWTSPSCERPLPAFTGSDGAVVGRGGCRFPWEVPGNQAPPRVLRRVSAGTVLGSPWASLHGFVALFHWFQVNQGSETWESSGLPGQ